MFRSITDRVYVALAGLRPERNEAQTNVEYALILFFVAIAGALALTIFGQHIVTALSSVNNSPGL